MIGQLAGAGEALALGAVEDAAGVLLLQIGEAGTILAAELGWDLWLNAADLRLIAADLRLPPSRYRTEPERAALRGELIERLERYPEVESVSLIRTMPVASGIRNPVLMIDGVSAPEPERTIAWE